MNAKLNLRCFALLFLIIGAKSAFAQEITNVFLAGSEGDPIFAACANTINDFNSFNFTATLSGNFETPQLDNIFILELSDGTGSFDAPVELKRTELSGVFNNVDYGNTPITIPNLFGNEGIPLPEDVAGENYNVRIRSTNPEVISAPSEPFSAFFYDGTTTLGFFEGDILDRDNQLAFLSICDSNGGANSVILNAIPHDGNYNAVDESKDPSSYLWYRSDNQTGPFNIIAGENGQTLTVSEAGVYRVSINSGACSTLPAFSNSFSDLINILVEGDDSTAIVDAFNNPVSNTTISVCQTDELTLVPMPDLTTTTYRWFRNGDPLTIPGLSKLELGDGNDLLIIPGVYTLEATSEGGCTSSSQVTVGVKNPEISIDKPDFLPIDQGEEVTLNAITDVANPQLQWFKGPFAVPGATGTSYVVTSGEIDDYKVRLSADSECGSETFSNTVTVFIATSYTAIIAFEEPALEGCDIDERTLIIEEIMATGVDKNNDPVGGLISPTIYDTLPLNWQLAGNDIDGATNASYTVTDFQQTGNYTLRVGTGISNPLDVNLRVPVSELTPSSAFLCFGSTVTITAFSDTFTYRWFFDNQPIEGETTNTIEVDAPGAYQAEVTAPGCEPTLTDELILEIFGDDVISVDPGFTVDMGDATTQTLTASGGESYTWTKVTKDDNGDILTEEVVGTEASLTVTDAIFSEGQVINYILTSKVGDCEVRNEIKIKRELSDLIPNLVTVNGDDINDRWVIPSVYVNKEDVEITIYNTRGELDFTTTKYQNNWPEELSGSMGNEAVYYYIINNKGNGETQKGSITVMR